MAVVMTSWANLALGSTQPLNRQTQGIERIALEIVVQCTV
jgi:hypothetical protein